MPGFLEHRGALTQLVREARKNKGDLMFIWLSLGNAYGSIPHRLVVESLEPYHVPCMISHFIMDNYNNFQVRVTSRITLSAWHRLEKVIITGCMISPALFALAMHMIVEPVRVRQPPVRAYLDDLTVTRNSETGGKWLLGVLKVI